MNIDKTSLVEYAKYIQKREASILAKLCMESTAAEEQRNKMLSFAKTKKDRNYLEKRFIYERNQERNKITRYTEDYSNYMKGLNKNVLENGLQIMHMKRLCKNKPISTSTSLDIPPKRGIVSDPKDLHFFEKYWGHIDDPKYSEKAAIKKAVTLKYQKSNIFNIEPKNKDKKRPTRRLNQNEYSNKYMGLLQEKKNLLSKLHTLVSEEERVLKGVNNSGHSNSNSMMGRGSISSSSRSSKNYFPTINNRGGGGYRNNRGGGMMSARSNDSVATFCDRSKQTRSVKQPSFVPSLKL